MSLHSALPGHFADDGDTVTLWYIKRRTGVRISDKAMPAYVTALIDHKGFPRPLPGFKKGQLVEVVAPRSRWRRLAVDTWLDNYLPPEALAAADAAAQAQAASEMDRAAAGLRLVGGREHG